MYICTEYMYRLASLLDRVLRTPYQNKGNVHPAFLRFLEFRDSADQTRNRRLYRYCRPCRAEVTVSFQHHFQSKRDGELVSIRPSCTGEGTREGEGVLNMDDNSGCCYFSL